MAIRPPARLRDRPAVALALAAAWLLSRRSPADMRTFLRAIRRGSRPATYDQAHRARDAILAVSLHCRSDRGCLERSIATVLLCRLRGTVPTWCVGVRTQPFAAHAWVEADGTPVDEPHPRGYYRPLITVAPIDRVVSPL
ncbi:lasso peptide biosynthesis B2 protein [Nocardia sp. NPDC088792]|uniref:lasso peptide biosynthesis B2 protein n=1 Tax=Nocardia sp. NPDC088792 TaxID=3364332 RepID=UPI0037FD46F6